MKSKTSASPGWFHQALVIFLTGAMLAGTILILNPASGGAAESVYYLGGLGQTTTFPNPLPWDSTYGQVNLACRTGWRFIQPTTGMPDWSTIDNCETAATNPSNHSTAKWSLSIKIGADTLLWLFNSSCTVGPGTGTLTAFQANWQQTYEYSIGSTQCLPVPWDTNFKAKLKAFIQVVYTHINATYPTHLPEHVVVTGINWFSQENVQPYCTVASSTCGVTAGVSDQDQWVNIMVAEHRCTMLSDCSPLYNGLITGAYNDIIGYWGGTGGFPSSVNLASMFVNSGVKSFPFNTTTTLGLDLLNEVQSYSTPSRSIVMNNAAQMDPGPDLVKPILCYAGTAGSFPCQSPQPTSTIAFQELGPVTLGISTNCGKLGTLLSTASMDLSAFMETYPIDISTCGL